jgi:putative phosphoribosyl transferase
VFYVDRAHAGHALADALREYAGRPDVVVLALPRGGVPVASRVAEALDAPFDVFLVRKLGFPGSEEFAMGAIASGGVRILNEPVLERYGVPETLIETVARREGLELARREKIYRGGQPPLEVRGKIVIVVDDGLATGFSMRAAVKALRALGPGKVVVAVPVGPRETVEDLRRIADEVVCPATPEPFLAVGSFYENFEQTSDRDVVDLLSRARRREPANETAGREA